MNTNRNIMVGASCSVGRTAYLHDIRETLTPNINDRLIGDNVVLIDLLQEIPRQDENGRTRTTEERIEALINKELDPYLHEYNAKQKRKDRRIKEEHYCDWHKNQGNKSDKMVYEFVMQYGTRDDLGKKYYAAETQEEKMAIRQEYIETYTKWLNDWQEKHPQMKVLWSVLHFDEDHGTPHSHTAILPIGNFEQKIAKQVSLSKCLENEGYPRLKTKKQGYQLARAFREFREIQERDLTELGYEIKAPGPNRPHLDRDQYIAEQQFLELQEKNQALTQENQAFKQENVALYEDIAELKAELDGIEAEKRKEEAELGVLKAKTNSELYKERRLMKKEVQEIPHRNVLGLPKIKECPGGKYMEVLKNEYEGMEQRINNFADGIKEIKQTDIAGQEQIKRLEELINNEMQFISQEVERILAEDKERIKENERKTQELKEKEQQLADREHEMIETIRETAKNLLRNALIQANDIDLTDYVKRNAPNLWKAYEKHLEQEQELAEEYINSVRIHRGR